MNHLLLADDVVGNVLAFCPTMQSLHAMILTCKPFYAVFKAHPESYLRAVYQNTVEYCLPCAIRVLRYPIPLADKPNDVIPPPETDDVFPITPEEQSQLYANARVVQRLENLFSRWYKNRGSTTIALTPTESSRFARAMYRIMLYCRRFHADWEEDELYRLFDVLERILGERRAMLDQYSTEALLEIHTVFLFLREIVDLIIQDSYNAPEHHAHDILTAFGPAATLEMYDSGSLDHLDRFHPISSYPFELFTGYFSEPLAQIYAARRIATPRPGSPNIGSILDEVQRKRDTCQQCLRPRASWRLWDETTWRFLVINLPSLLKGNLPLNRTECVYLFAFFPEGWGAGLSSAIPEMHAQKDPEFSGWTPEDTLCQACLERFISAHLHLWLFQRKAKEGWIPTRNCRYGYACDAQADVYSDHAETMNHLCSPVPRRNPA